VRLFRRRRRVRWLGSPQAHAYPVQGFWRWAQIICYSLCGMEELPVGLRVSVDSRGWRCHMCEWARARGR
jgi:hypothetical protein